MSSSPRRHRAAATSRGTTEVVRGARRRRRTHPARRRRDRSTGRWRSKRRGTTLYGVEPMPGSGDTAADRGLEVHEATSSHTCAVFAMACSRRSCCPIASSGFPLPSLRGLASAAARTLRTDGSVLIASVARESWRTQADPITRDLRARTTARSGHLGGAARARRLRRRAGPSRCGVLCGLRSSPMTLEVAYVVSRFGVDVPGGAEFGCRMLAERLVGVGRSRRPRLHDVRPGRDLVGERVLARRHHREWRSRAPVSFGRRSRPGIPRLRVGPLAESGTSDGHRGPALHRSAGTIVSGRDRRSRVVERGSCSSSIPTCTPRRSTASHGSDLVR